MMKDLKGREYVFLIIITLFYAALAFWNLGSHHIPSTGWERQERGGEIFLDLGEDCQVAGIAWFLGNYENREFEFSWKAQEGNWIQAGKVTMENVYQWGQAQIRPSLTARYLRLFSLNQYVDLRELAVLDEQGGYLEVQNKEDYPELFDEWELYEEKGNGHFQAAVFDESVFARTAWEYLNGIRSYEDTHPPLGKLLISLGIWIFGMNPFGWRAVPALTGTLMLPALYLALRFLTGKAGIAAGGTLLLAFDFLHFTVTRLAAVDGMLVLAILISHSMMYQYGRYVRQKAPWTKKGAALAVSGLFMGVGIGCKWSGCYSAAGLCILFFWMFGEGCIKGWISKKEGIRTILLCCAAFLLVPAALYICSYIPYVSMDPDAGFLEGMITNQKNMYLYHATYNYDHHSASMWFQWPLTIKPVTVVYGSRDGMIEVMKAMGNPVVWWAGTAAVFWGMFQAVGKGDRKAAYLLISYGSQLLPWAFISRASFLYHYFPAMIFSVLLIGYWASQRERKGILILGAAAVLAAAFFYIYYPVIAGQPIFPEQLEALDWLPGWDLTSP